jgi:hypothetical protein
MSLLISCLGRNACCSNTGGYSFRFIVGLMRLEAYMENKLSVNACPVQYYEPDSTPISSCHSSGLFLTNIFIS